MKKFFSEFKAFITRGNILDLAVGVIIGGAFNAIVTTLNAKILMPLVNWALSHIPGMESGLYTILPNSVLADATAAQDAVTLGPDGLSYTVLNYIDWSAFIESILNFFFIALTLFIIVKVAMVLSQKRKALEEKLRKEHQEEVVEEAATEPEPTPDPVVTLLEEIRDTLKEKDKSGK